MKKSFGRAAYGVPALSIAAMLLLGGCAGPQTREQANAEISAERVIQAAAGMDALGGIMNQIEQKAGARLLPDEAEGVAAVEPEAGQSAFSGTNPKSLSAAEQTALAFADAVIAGDYEAAFEQLALKDTTFVSPDDLAYYLPRTDFADLAGTAAVCTAQSSSGNRDDCVVTLKYGADPVRLHIIMDADNTYKVDFDDFVVKDWRIELPKNAAVTLNGQDISGYITEKAAHSAYAQIPAIAKRACNVRIETDFGTFEQEITPLNEDTATDLVQMCTITDEEFCEGVYAAVKNMLNQMQDAYEEGQTGTDFVRFLGGSLDVTAAQTLYDKIRSAYTGYYELTNMYFSYLGAGPDRALTSSVAAVERNVLKVPFCTTKTWDHVNQTMAQGETVNLTGEIYVTYENGETRWTDLGECSFLEEKYANWDEW